MKKIIILIDAILIVGTILLIGFGSLTLTGNPILEFPDNGLNTSDVVLFSFKNADYVLIDDNTQFSSARRIESEDSFVVRLDPGTYYWKAVGEKESEIRYFTILSEVSLELRKSETGYEVINAGNTVLEVEFYDDGELVKKDSFAPGTKSEVNGDRIIGSQYE